LKKQGALKKKMDTSGAPVGREHEMPLSFRQQLLRKIPYDKQDGVWRRIESDYPWVLHEYLGYPTYPIVVKPDGELYWDEDELMITLARETSVGCFHIRGALSYAKASRVLTEYQLRELARRLGYSLAKYRALFKGA
jgi:hypothetical protein